ncbi:MAG: S41 family peptidase [Bacteroidales bacterium]|nr:S41 family peptidase [Bacteroidales bacterium]
MKRLAIMIVVLLVSWSAATVMAQPMIVPDTTSAGQLRVDEVMGMIDGNYVERPDMDKMGETAINAMLKALDPHSVYIPAREVKRANEGLQGNFEGVGVSFQIVSDTIVFTDVIAGGPSEKVGIMAGDRLLRVDGKPATGDSIGNDFVFRHLRGEKGTEVVLDILREGRQYTFRVVRDKIPIYSIDTYFMANDSTGYIRLTRFARTSIDEFHKAMKSLKGQGMRGMILDLRGNTGGFLDIAYRMANEFLEREQLIVYTMGRASPRQNFRANGRGGWKAVRGEDGSIVGNRLVVLIDEGSASASEIVSGAVQDWDRGVLVGRRSFGKGLVQRMFPMKDGGQVRLTTARYYTPSGRCIQRPYDEGTDAYRKDVGQRMKHGEMVNADSIHFVDSLKYTTAGGRIVYGGGGIMPDVFVPMDTMRLTDYFISLRGNGLLNQFPLQWVNTHRADERLQNFADFESHYDQLGIDTLLAAEAERHGIVRDRDKEAAEPDRTRHSDRYLSLLLKAQVARYLYGIEYYYQVMKADDEGYRRACEVMWQD